MSNLNSMYINFLTISYNDVIIRMIEMAGILRYHYMDKLNSRYITIIYIRP
jgi:hypothetical protein